MDSPILFNPDNRLLGGASGDFSLYGGQSDPQFAIQQARDDAPFSRPEGGQAVAAPDAAAGQAAGDAPADELQAEAATPQGETGGGAFAPASFLIAAPETGFEPVAVFAPAAGAAPLLADWNSAPLGAGAPVLAPQTAASAPEGVVSGTAATMLDELAGGTHGIAAGLVPPLADTGGALQAVTGAVEDTLADLAGSDPLGGVATLVDLVSVSDTFDLAPVVAPLAEAVSDTGLGVLDTLVDDDLLPDALLGAHHDDGLLGIDHHDNPLGL